MGRKRVSKAFSTKDGHVVALKTHQVEKSLEQQLMDEIRHLVCADFSPFVLQVYGALVLQETRTGAVQIVLEYMDLGSLADLRKRIGQVGLQKAHLSCIAAQMTRGLEHLHKKQSRIGIIEPK